MKKRPATDYRGVLKTVVLARKLQNRTAAMGAGAGSIIRARSWHDMRLSSAFLFFPLWFFIAAERVSGYCSVASPSTAWAVMNETLHSRRERLKQQSGTVGLA